MILWTHYEYGSMLILVCFDAVTKKNVENLLISKTGDIFTLKETMGNIWKD